MEKNLKHVLTFTDFVNESKLNEASVLNTLAGMPQELISYVHSTYKVNPVVDITEVYPEDENKSLAQALTLLLDYKTSRTLLFAVCEDTNEGLYLYERENARYNDKSFTVEYIAWRNEKILNTLRYAGTKSELKADAKTFGFKGKQWKVYQIRNDVGNWTSNIIQWKTKNVQKGDADAEKNTKALYFGKMILGSKFMDKFTEMAKKTNSEIVKEDIKKLADILDFDSIQKYLGTLKDKSKWHENTTDIKYVLDNLAEMPKEMEHIGGWRSEPSIYHTKKFVSMVYAAAKKYNPEFYNQIRATYDAKDYYDSSYQGDERFYGLVDLSDEIGVDKMLFNIASVVWKLYLEDGKSLQAIRDNYGLN